MKPSVLWPLIVALIGCAPPACDDADDRLARDVEILIGPSSERAKSAQVRLVSHGPRAVPLVEVGLYQADAAGRRRIVSTLAGIGDPVVLPVLDHLAANDPDELVRSAAVEAASAVRRARSAGP